MPTPQLNDPEVKKLLLKMGLNQKPQLVIARTEPGAILFECVDNVNKMVYIVGGDIKLGWQIWKTDNSIEAEFHAVWENPQRLLIDITPKQFPINQIMFVPDPSISLDGMQIPNYMINLSKNPLVDDLILVAEAKFDFLNRGERAKQKELRLTVEQDAHGRFMVHVLSMINYLLDKKGSRESICPCGDTLKFKDCHGKNLASKLASVQ